jgi:iron(II)-dependent oxidoreductase
VIAAALDESRARLLALLAPLDDDALTKQHSPLMSPLAWDLAHIGNYEDIWLVRALGSDVVST